MIYSGEANGQDITTMSEKLIKQNSTSFPIADKTLYANQGSRIILSWIHQVYGGWIYDDKNNTDFPEAVGTLTSGQQDYLLPVNLTFLQGVSIKDISGNWKILKPITLEQIQQRGDEAEFQKTNGIPEFYRPSSGSIKTYPTSNFTQSSSLKLHYTRDISGFLITDTTKVPGFDIQYHEALPVYMALQYAKINSLPQLQTLQFDWDGDETRTGREGGYKKMIKGDYSRKFNQLFPPSIKTSDAVLDYI